MALDEIMTELKTEHGLSDGSVALLQEKLSGDPKNLEGNFSTLLAALKMPDETFSQHRARQSRLEIILARGDSPEMTTGRYGRYTEKFRDISSEQALVQQRMRFAVEYVIALADFVAKNGACDEQFIPRRFTSGEKTKLRSIYENYRIQDYAAVKIIERGTKHDVVAANTWVAVRAQQLGLDDRLMRRIIHFARTSADVDTNACGHLFMKAIGQWTNSLANLVHMLESKAHEYESMTCIAETHGQPAQLTTLGYIYANLAEQIRLYASPLLQRTKLRVKGKIGGAIGTDVDMHAAFPNLHPETMYRTVVRKFGLSFAASGNDQDVVNDELVTALDTMVNVGMVVQKAATDTWIYASRAVLAKVTKGGESGSSAMPQKANPFLAEGTEALMEIIAGMVTPMKKMLVAYREQGDLRRSITTRERYHPIMLSVIGMERLVEELGNYRPNVAAMETEIYAEGPKIASSAVSTILRRRGMSDAYDSIKGVTMRPFVKPEEVQGWLHNLEAAGEIDSKTAQEVEQIVTSVMDTGNYLAVLNAARSPENISAAIAYLERANRDVLGRSRLLGNADKLCCDNMARAEHAVTLLRRYAI